MRGPDRDKLAKQDREKGTQQLDNRKYCSVRNTPVGWDKAKHLKISQKKTKKSTKQKLNIDPPQQER